MNIMQEKTIKKYFQCKAVFGNGIDAETKRKIFYTLADIFCVDPSAKDALFSMCEADWLNSISDYKHYKRVNRVLEYAAMNNEDPEMSMEDMIMFSLKGEALYQLVDAKIVEEEREYTLSEQIDRLLSLSNQGNTFALFATALMNKENILVEGNANVAERSVKRLSRWLDVDGLLLAIYYSLPENRHSILSNLQTVTFATPDEETYDIARNNYGLAETHCNVGTQLLMKAVTKGLVTKDQYSAKYARIIYSEVLSSTDKQRAVLSDDKEFVSLVSSLPLKLSDKRPLEARAELPHTVFERIDEENRIFRYIYSPALKANGVLCITSNDEYLLAQYSEAIKQSVKSGRVTQIDFDQLADADLCEDSKNVFLRSLSETESNLLLISVTGHHDDAKLQKLFDFLPKNSRKRFSIGGGCLDMDLSSVMIVLFADAKVQRQLGKKYIVYTLKEVDETEKRRACVEMFDEKSSELMLEGQISISDDALDELASYGLNTAQTVLNRVCTTAVFDGKQVIDKQYILDKCGDLNGSSKRFGFGGGNNERD